MKTAHLDVGVTQHVFSGQPGVRLPPGCENKSRKYKGEVKWKEVAVTHSEKEEPSGRAKLLTTLRNKCETRASSRQSHGHMVTLVQV